MFWIFEVLSFSGVPPLHPTQACRKNTGARVLSFDTHTYIVSLLTPIHIRLDWATFTLLWPKPLGEGIGDHISLGLPRSTSLTTHLVAANIGCPQALRFQLESWYIHPVISTVLSSTGSGRSGINYSNSQFRYRYLTRPALIPQTGILVSLWLLLWASVLEISPKLTH